VVYVLSFFVTLCFSKTVFRKNKLFFRALIFGYFRRVIKINERNGYISVGYLTGSASYIYLQCNNTFENSTTISEDKALADLADPPGPVGLGATKHT